MRAITEAELAELRRRWSDLPATPWTLESTSEGSFVVLMSRHEGMRLGLSLSGAQTMSRAREDVERLLDEIERLRKKGKQRAKKSAPSRRQKRS